MKRLFSLALGAILLLSSCSAPVRTGNNRLPPETALKLALQQNNRLLSFRGRCRVSIETPNQAQNFDASIYFIKPDSMLLTIDYLFGADAAYLVIIGDRYLFYNKVNDNFLSGGVNDEFSKAFFQLPIPLSELSRLLVANVSVDSSAFSSKPDILDEGYLYEVNRAGKKLFFLVDPFFSRFKRVEVYDEKNDLLLSEEFGEFEKSGTIFFPREIILKRPTVKQYISVYYTSVEINKKIDGGKFKITVPPSSKQLDLDAR